MASLFELVNEYQALFDLATEDGDPAVLADTLEGWLPEITQKAEGYVNVINKLDMEAKTAREIGESFMAKAKARENSIKAMKNALLIAMDRMDATEIKAGAFTIKAVKNGGKEPVIIDNERSIPQSLMKVIYEVDKERLREYLKENPKCEFAHIGERGKHITIK